LPKNKENNEERKKNRIEKKLPKMMMPQWLHGLRAGISLDAHKEFYTRILSRVFNKFSNG